MQSSKDTSSDTITTPTLDKQSEKVTEDILSAPVFSSKGGLSMPGSSAQAGSAGVKLCSAGTMLCSASGDTLLGCSGPPGPASASASACSLLAFRLSRATLRWEAPGHLQRKHWHQICSRNHSASSPSSNVSLPQSHGFKRVINVNLDWSSVSSNPAMAGSWSLMIFKVPFDIRFYDFKAKMHVSGQRPRWYCLLHRICLM